ncbi:tRNA lysidine(34) synthetase TilS [Lachnospiraceae bacterium C1.1]|nr:tRNA lysidine(34) synthetase TilS [Lachnospiraceae bacterium C1.1]
MKINDRVKKFIKENNMVTPGQRVVAGVSGGADSVCLLFLLYELKEELGYSLSVVHIEHGIRGEASLMDAEYVEKLCEELDLPCRTVHINAPKLAAEKGESLEEAARNARYEEFEREGADRIAVAHHACDAAETMLFNLFRGSSIWGMGSIAPVRGKIIRPLLCLTREEIEEYLRERKIDFRTDETNFDTEIPRNAIRHEIIPIAEKINSNAVKHIAAAASDIRDWSDFISTELDRLERKYTRERNAEIEVDLALLENAPEIAVSEILRRALGRAAGRLKDISRVHVRDVMSLAVKTSGSRISLPYGIYAERVFDKLLFKREDKNTFRNYFKDYQEEAPQNGEIIAPDKMQYTFNLDKIKNSAGFPTSSYTKWFDYDKIRCIPVVRTRRNGDYMAIKNGRKKLKDVFTEAHIAADKRDEISLLADGDHIIWIPGIRMSEAYKIDGSTTRIWEVTASDRNNTQ